MTPFANATTPVKAAQGTALALGACALFLLVASNVLLLGLQASRWRLSLVGDRHRLAALRRRPAFRPLADALDAGRRDCGLRPARRHPPAPSASPSRQRPFRFRARDQGRRPAIQGGPAARPQGRRNALLRRIGTRPRLRAQPAPARASAMSFQTCSIGRIRSLRSTSRRRTGIAPRAFAPPTGRRSICSIRSTRTVAPRATIHWAMCAAIPLTSMTICSASR